MTGAKRPSGSFFLFALFCRLLLFLHPTFDVVPTTGRTEDAGITRRWHHHRQHQHQQQHRASLAFGSQAPGKARNKEQEELMVARPTHKQSIAHFTQRTSNANEINDARLLGQWYGSRCSHRSQDHFSVQVLFLSFSRCLSSWRCQSVVLLLLLFN